MYCVSHANVALKGVLSRKSGMRQWEYKRDNDSVYLLGMAPFSRKVMLSVLAFVLAAGGYGGYRVVKDDTTYGADFEKRLHVVEEVVDGDTFIIEDDIRIRLLGIDAPEKSECFGAEAKEHLSSLILGQEVLLEKDQTASDGFDRLLRYVVLRSDHPEVDDVMVNVVMVSEGYAESQYLRPNRRYLAKIQAAERGAQDEELGIWGACDSAENEADPEREQDSEPFSDECVIKGNINKRYEKDYFLPGCPNYKRVKVDPRKGEKWFCSAEEAEEDGWQKSAACNNIWQTRD